MEQFEGTTIIAVRRGKNVAIAGDGQVTFGKQCVIKGNANKLRKFYNDKVIAGFAGATADAFTLFERFEAKLEQSSGQLMRAAVSFAKDWRTDKTLRPLEAMLLIADIDSTLMITGNGDVMQPEADVIAIGSGGSFAHSAGIALLNNTKLSANTIAKKSIEIAASICIYTNNNINITELK